MKNIFLFLCLISFSFVYGQNQPKGERLTDSERLIRIETLIYSMDKRLDKSEQTTNDLRKEMNELRKEMNENTRWIIGVVVSAIIALIGFMFWDRLTHILPLRKKIAKALDH